MRGREYRRTRAGAAPPDMARGADSTVAALADEMIAKCARAPRTIIPFGDRIGSARGELIAAIDASGTRGAPKNDPRKRRQVRADAAETALLALLKKLGFGVRSVGVLKNARTRLKKG